MSCVVFQGGLILLSSDRLVRMVRVVNRAAAAIRRARVLLRREVWTVREGTGGLQGGLQGGSASVPAGGKRQCRSKAHDCSGP